MKHPLNEFFDTVFIISIKRNQKRLDEFLNRNPNLEVEVYEGVDGKELYPEIDHAREFPPDFFEQHQLSYDRCKHWNKGQLGCAMSNVLVQKKIVQMQINKALILEDDAFLLEERFEYFKQALNELPADWELFYLGFNTTSRWSQNPYTRLLLRLKHFITPRITEGMSSGTISGRYFPVSFSARLNKPGIYGGTHAYALSYAGAKKIVALDTPLRYGFDTSLMYANYHKLINSYSLKKPLIVPNNQFETSLIN